MKHGVWAFVALGLAGCFGSPFEAEQLDTSSTSQLASDKCKKKPKKKCVATIATVGVDGGTLTTPDGLVLDIPFGAVDQPTELTVTATTLDPDPAIGGSGIVYSFEPEGTIFVRPVRVTLPLPAGMTAASVYWTKLGSTEFEAIGGDISGSTITASTFHFSLAQVGSPVTETPVRGQAFETFITATSTERRSRPGFVDPSEIQVIVGDGAGGYTTLDAGPVLDTQDPPQEIPGWFQIDDVPSGGDFIVRTGNQYLVTSDLTLDLGTSFGGHFPEELTEATTEKLNVRVTNMVPWQADDQLEMIVVEPDNWMFEAQRFNANEATSEFEDVGIGAQNAFLAMPLSEAGGGAGPLELGALVKSNHRVLLAQLSNSVTETGVQYEAIARVGEAPRFDMTAGQDSTVDISLDVDLTDDNTLRFDYRGEDFVSMVLGTPTEPGHPDANPFCDFICGGFMAVLAQPGEVADGFYGANADMMIMFDTVGANFDTGTLRYGAAESLGADDWGLLFLARWNAAVQYQLPDTSGPAGALGAQAIDWTTTPELVDGGVVAPPMSRPRNILVNGQPFYAGSSTNVGESPTLTWDPPSLRPMIPPAGGGAAVPAPITYGIVVRRLFVSADNLTRSTAPLVRVATHDTSFTFPPGILDPTHTYVFTLSATAGTTTEGSEALENQPLRATPHVVSVRTASAIFGDAVGTPPIAMPIADAQMFPWGIVAGPEGVFWADRGDDAFADPPQSTSVGRIFRAELDGSNPTALVENLPVPTAVAVDGNAVYWTNRGPFDEVNGYFPHGSIQKLDLATSEVTTLLTDEPNLYSPSLVVHNGDVFFIGAGIRVLRNGATAADTLDPGGGINLAGDGTNIYWTDYGSGPTNGRVLQIPIGGGLAVPIAEGGAQTWDVQTDGTFVYFSNQAWEQAFPATIERVPVGGGAVDVVAIGLELGASEIMKVFGIDGSYAYYVDLYDRLMRAPLDGSSAPENLGFLDAGGWCPQGKIAVFGGAAYWTDTCGQMVMRAVLP